MGRHKKFPDAEETITSFFSSVSDSFNHPGAGGDEAHTPINVLAEEFNISRLKVRKILITTGDLTYPETARIQSLLADGMKKAQVMEETGMAISTLNSFLPYEKGVYNLADVSIYAESSKLYRLRKEAVAALTHAIQYGTFEEQSYQLWRCVCLFAGYPFVTSGRGSRNGVKFKYEVSVPGEKGGRHYDGQEVEGFGNELWVIRAGEQAEKSISRSSVDYALKIVMDGTEITGPKSLKIYGASYVYGMFRRFGLV